MVNRPKIALKIVPYIAGIVFAGMWVTAIHLSSEISSLQNTGFNLYHDPVDVQIFWFESKACMVLPPDSYLANCVYIRSIGVISVLTISLLVVLFTYMVLRRHVRIENLIAKQPRSPR